MPTLIEVISSLDIPSNITTPTLIPGVKIFRGDRYLPRQPILYNPGICILLQGRKFMSLAGVNFPYDADNYLVVSVNVPIEAETFGAPENPVIGMLVDIDLAQLNELMTLTGNQHNLSECSRLARPKAVEPARMATEMRDAIERMAVCLLSPVEARVLGPGLVREILFRVLCGPQSSALYELANHTGSFSRIANVLRIIQTNYAAKIDVEYLAKKANMGTSAFHQAFKEVTSESPMQYLKKVRLTKARDLIMQDREKVYVAADSVGYESTSQFSREFKRYFGTSPSALARLPELTKKNFTFQAMPKTRPGIVHPIV